MKDGLTAKGITITGVDFKVGDYRAFAGLRAPGNCLAAYELLVEFDEAHLTGVDGACIIGQFVTTPISFFHAHHVQRHGAEGLDVKWLACLPQEVPKRAQMFVGRMQFPGEFTCE